MQYMFFDTAVNGYYTLAFLQKELENYKPLIAASEKISDDVAPFIFEIDSDKLSIFLKNETIALDKIILFDSKETIDAVKSHFSRLVIQNIKGKEFYFRFWASDVFKKFIKTCKAEQIKEFFGPVDSFVTDAETNEEATIFKQQNGKLTEERMPAGKVVDVVGEDKVSGKSSANKTVDINAPEILPEGKKPPRRFIY